MRRKTRITTRKYGRRRRIAGRVLLSLGLIITSIWWMSRWWWMGYTTLPWSGPSTISIEGGVLSTCTVVLDSGRSQESWPSELSGPPCWRIRRGNFPLRWRLHNDPYDNWIQTGEAPETNLLIIAHTPAGYSPDGGIWMDYTQVALWPPALCTCAGGLALLWSSGRTNHRLRAGCCSRCGYDLRGLTLSAACPEYSRDERTKA